MPPSSQDPTGPSPIVAETGRRQDIEFAAKDAGLRQDVHDLGTVVGELLAEQGGPELFEAVETARQAAIGAREGDADAARTLEQLVGSLSATETRDFIRAFSTYFQAVNTAELVHRIRRRRDYLREGLHRQPGGLEDAFFRLRDRGVSLDEIARLLPRLHVMPVLTAHPTEPTRRTILRRQQDIVRRLIDRQNTALSPREMAADLASIRTDLTAIWQTEEHPAGARTVADELEHILYFMTDIVYRVVPLLYENLATGLEAAYGDEARDVELPVLVEMGSWIGGDLVGRNEITARTIRDTLARQRALVLDLYYRSCRQLAGQLSQSTTRVGVDPELLERIGAYSGHFPNAEGLTPLRHREMPYRVFMGLVMARLQSTYSDGLYPYESADELAGDMRLVARSLGANRGVHGGLFAANRLIRQIETFGFHFMTLDVRQEAPAIRRIVGRCLHEEHWLVRPPEQRAERLRRALLANESPAGDLDNEAKRAVGIFQAIAFCRRRHGPKAIGPFIVSLAEGADDVLAVLLLAQWGELRRQDGSVPLDVAPSFESVGGLAGAASVMKDLYAEPVYREHLAARGRRQTVMIGIADGDIESDLVSARTALLNAHRELTGGADDAGLDLTVFHGRSGPVSPGGGKAHADVLSSPPGTVRGRTRALEPGELVANKYGVRAIALRTVEQLLAAVVEATAKPAGPEPGERPAWEAALADIAAASRSHYQALVIGSPDFGEYYRLSTPADVIERMRRGGGAETSGDEGLLAAAGTAPWVFAWTQSRNILPGWYGFGTGISAAVERHGEQVLQEMVDGWYFFRTLVQDVEMTIARSDLAIAARYSALAGPLHERFFPLIRMEFDLAVSAVLKLRRQTSLLEGSSMRRSIRLRNPYVDPMNLLQVDLLRRWRQSGDETLFAALTASVNGIARGLQDAG